MAVRVDTKKLLGISLASGIFIDLDFAPSSSILDAPVRSRQDG
jgi:hypothetical protein